jgi:8-oxo-dGTP pyrophosphatase MutT (NUDIX family)
VTDPVIRPAARAVILAPTGRILLFHGDTDLGPAWYTPGGGVEPGETHEEAAAREVREETGRTDIAIGPCVWFRQRFRPGRSGTTIDLRSRFFLAHSPEFAIDLAVVRAEEGVDGARWWTLAEIECSNELFIPPHFGKLLGPLLRGEIPATPIDTSI